MKKNWQAKLQFHADIITQLLLSRGLDDEAKQKAFFDPVYSMLYDPFLIKDMDIAVDRITRAVTLQEKITVYADYDADAVTASAVLLRFFENLRYTNIDYYIPDRFAEGYGMNVEAMDVLKERGTNLVITVDCGINAVSSVAMANVLGMDVIITDHHQITGDLPRAIAVVNPHRIDDSYPCKDLTGVGVAFKLVQALIKKRISHQGSAVAQGWEKWLLDLVAIGTVADCQNLLDENRILVKWGLQVLGRTRWIGLQKLLALANLENGPFDTYKIGFVIAPRINAAGRIEHASIALDLLLCNDETKAIELATRLEQLNKHRQKLTESVVSEAREQIMLSADKKILLAAGSGWPKGIVGLVAGKLTEEFARPVLVLEKGSLEATGSARSVGSFNIVEAIGKNENILVKYGGHPGAAGFTLLNEHIETFHKNLCDYADDFFDKGVFNPVLLYDAVLPIENISDSLVSDLEKFAPFGQGNPRPIFRVDNLVARDVTGIGQEGKHLRLIVTAQGIRLQCIGFGLGYWARLLSGTDNLIDIVCEPQYNEWNGRKSIQLRIIDLKSHE